MPRSSAGIFFVQNPVLIGALRSSSAINQNFSDMGGEVTATIPLTGTAAMTGPAKMADGSQVVPGISFAGDADSGFRRSSANAIAWVSGGADRKRIAADGTAYLLGDGNTTGAMAVTGKVKVGAIAGIDEIEGQGFIKKAPSGVSRDDAQTVVSFDIEARSVFTGGLMPMTTGVRADIRFPFACVLTGIALAVDQVGSMVLDIWKSSLASYPPVAGGSICGSSKPTISMAASYSSTALGGWTTSIAAGDVLRFNVDSASNVSRASVTITARRF